eukprot:1865510-Rhodomonas_salina.1
MLFWVHDCIDAIGQIEAELYSKHPNEKDCRKGDEEDSCSDKSSGGESLNVSDTLMKTLSVNECEQCRAVLQGLSQEGLCAIPLDLVDDCLRDSTLGDMMACLRCAEERLEHEIDAMSLLLSDKEARISAALERLRREMELGVVGY